MLCDARSSMRKLLSSSLVVLAACGNVEGTDAPDAAVPTAPDATPSGVPDAPLPPGAECEAGKTICSGDETVVCDDAGQIDRTIPCGGLGCWDDLAQEPSVSGTGCADLDPSNGLAALLDMTGAAADVTLANGTVINSSSGAVRNGTTDITLPSTLASGVRVFYVKSLVIGDVTLTSTAAGSSTAPTPSVAFVASGPIDVTGTILAKGGPGAAPAPGASECASAERTRARGAEYRIGGAPANPAGTNEPLYGGCSSPAWIDKDVVYARGGGGGGALQLVSRTSVTLQGTARVNVGGGGGGGGSGHASSGGAGGGGGGNILIEAPVVTSATQSIVAANGGGGGACEGTNGQDGALSTAPAAGGTRAGAPSGGAGAAGAMSTGQNSVATVCTIGSAGGGGGLGLVYVRTRAGGASLNGTVSGSLGVGALKLRRLTAQR
jgi:hypothetical protein